MSAEQLVPQYALVPQLHSQAVAHVLSITASTNTLNVILVVHTPPRVFARRTDTLLHTWHITRRIHPVDLYSGVDICKYKVRRVRTHPLGGKYMIFLHMISQ